MPEKVVHFGRQLERARREKKIPLPDAAQHLCIRRDLLAALEREDIKPFQSRAYAVGFLKAYADYLSLDPAPLVLSLKQKFGPGTPIRTDPGTHPRKGRAVSVLAIVFLLLLAGAAAWFGWQYWAGRNAGAGIGGGDVVAADASLAGLAQNVRPAAFLGGGAERLFRNMIASQSVRLVAIGEARIAVRDPRGRIVREGVLYPGEGFDLPVGIGLTVLTPDSTALAFFMDGRRAEVPVEAEQGLARFALDRVAVAPEAPAPAS